jgi:prepilin-type N-terminal cleavage/methylation domain-containing protein
MILSRKPEFMRLHGAAERSESGVSLVELMTVLVIIAILSLAALYANAGYEGFRDRVAVKGFQAAVLSKMREAKNVAKATNENVTMKFDLDNEKVWIEVDGQVYGSVVAPASPRAELKGFELQGSPPPNPSVVYTGIQSMTFYSRGSSAGSGSLSSNSDDALHFGYKDSLYAVGQPSGNYRTIVVLGTSSRAEAFDQGCMVDNDNVSNWSWPDCATL